MCVPVRLEASEANFLPRAPCRSERPPGPATSHLLIPRSCRGCQPGPAAAMALQKRVSLHPWVRVFCVDAECSWVAVICKGNGLRGGAGHSVVSANSASCLPAAVFPREMGS